jgi:hypothetical protein
MRVFNAQERQSLSCRRSGAAAPAIVAHYDEIGPCPQVKARTAKALLVVRCSSFVFR